MRCRADRLRRRLESGGMKTMLTCGATIRLCIEPFSRFWRPPPSVRPEATVRRAGAAPTRAHRRSAGLARRPPGGVQVADHRRAQQQDASRRSTSAPVAGGAATQITQAGQDNERPRWSPDSKHIAFISDRGGSSQIWLMDADGSNPRQVTNLSTEAGGVLFSPDGKNLVFTSEVFPQCGADDACNQKATRRREERQGEGAHLHRPALPALESLAGRAAQPLAGGSGKPAARPRT